ncbi:mercuric transport protein MerTP [Mucilaginibacter sabulilitoris]|uniref:Mercuric transport protein MerT n=1 Tax=Mucilaginibacter sabulilitoris TaxID=1173583 RepID=A0ABZ0TTK9_9SPHI|nr:mercuric transport protein MerTP [Mucilaginibacter sabulilitoris]WPU96446.1 mercuric transport protein MerTP [Mucilaginibacter sabulilitoris]
MITTNANKSWIPGLLAALTASLCCITPVVALLGGVSGMASSFSWIEPARPYLISFTILVFAFTWYQRLNKKTQTNDCCEVRATSFWQSKKLLLIVTVLSAILITFPYYSSVLYCAPKQSSAITIQQNNLKWVQLTVRGMGCADCTKHIDGVLSKVPGVVKVSTSFEKAQTSVNYDPKKTSAGSLKNKITQIGYQVTSVK